MHLPQAFLNALQSAPFFVEEEFIAAHGDEQPITSIRVNPAKEFNVAPHFANATPVPWSSNGYYLQERPLFTTDIPFAAGAYYVQEASSMFLEYVIQQTIDLSKDVNVLDLCAAPGGKSTLIQSLLTANSLLVANEVIKSRVGILIDNITKWGAANCIVTNNDATQFSKLTGFFDVIVVDAPCSGSGLFRKDENAIIHWSIENVNLCSQRQQRVLMDVLPALKKDGILIYSTCSYSVEENEDVVDFLLQEGNLSSIEIPITQFEGIVQTQSKIHKGFGYRFYPNKVKGEGFFIAAFKNNNQNLLALQARVDAKQLASAFEKEILAKLLQIQNVEIVKFNNSFLALPKALLNAYFILQKKMYVKKVGIELGEIIKEQLIPNHALAVSSSIQYSFPCIEVDASTALDYLRKQTIQIQTDKKGWAIVTCNGFKLGWVKLLSGRVNNYYPTALRILNK
jgi:NOL1/NOP2/sun family putative RNA methylase